MNREINKYTDSNCEQVVAMNTLKGAYIRQLDNVNFHIKKCAELELKLESQRIETERVNKIYPIVEELKTFEEAKTLEEKKSVTEDEDEVKISSKKPSVMSQFAVWISRMKTYRAKKLAKKHVKGDYVEQYTLLQEYANELIQKIQEMLWKCVDATIIPEFTLAMDELKAFNKKAHVWLSKIPPLHWSRSHFSGRVISDILLNNMCEVYNGKIVEGKDKPIISALEYIREYLMRMIVTVLKLIEKSEGLLTPKATEVLIGSSRIQLTTMFSGMEGITTRHVVATLWEKAATSGRMGDLESWVHPFYTMERWKLVYSFKVNPINGRTLWTNIQLATIIVPPKHHTQVGRPKKLRKRSVVELEELTQSGRLSKRHSKVACTKCKKTGHNSRTCKGQGQAGNGAKVGKG
ncbi:uncharacterized protein LOC110870516 [Helianthus annuus]|uniref:uncharacterized protein LOC110870516 n=1 Tax=Helianthus annuus TaxID=4232 RepID=UPI000B8F68DA|nr:uncharacterized protein LOC110870516 [Helianthus annuus]